MTFWQRSLRLLLPAGLILLATACASSSALDETQSQVSALQQQVDTLSQQLDSTKSDLASTQNDVSTLKGGLTTAQSDVTELKNDLGTAQSDVTELKNGLGTTQSDVTKVKTDLGGVTTDLVNAKADLSSTATSLDTLDNTFLMHQGDMDGLHAAQSEAGKVALVKHLIDIFLRTSNDSSEETPTAVAVADAINDLGDNALAEAWDAFIPALKEFADAANALPENPTTAQALAFLALAVEYSTKNDTLIALLRQKLVGTVE